MPGSKRIACFVSPHGFGHAARAAAILQALADRCPALEVELFTTVPRWFFEESLDFPFHYRECACDVGLVQKSPVEEDLSASVAALERLWLPDAEKARTRAEVARELVASGVDLVLCDIAPLGLEVARLAGLPSVLLENFTWDWIYEPLVALEPRLGDWVPFLRQRFALADLHLQLEPVCAPVAGALSVPPVARAARQDAAEVRERLSIPEGHALVLVSLGGIAHRLEGLAPLAAFSGATFVIPGASEREEAAGNLRLLPHHSPVHHPDLTAAADLVVGKLGYSTVAECVGAGARMLYVPRPGFRESVVLERFVGDRLPVASISFQELESGSWVKRLPEVLSRKRPAPGLLAAPERGAGAAIAAAAIANYLDAR